MRTLLRFLPWALWLVCVNVSAATFWTGPEVSFSKTPFADPTLAANQDRLAAMPGEIATRIHKALAASQRPVGAGAGVLFHPLFARARRCGALSNERVTQVRASASVSRVFSPLDSYAHWANKC